MEELGKVETSYVLPTSQNPLHWNPYWLSNVHATRKDLESRVIESESRKSNPINIRPEIATMVAEQSSWAPLPFCLLCARAPLSTKSLFVHTCVSAQFTYSVTEELILGLLTGAPFLKLKSLKQNQIPERYSVNIWLKS